MARGLGGCPHLLPVRSQGAVSALASSAAAAAAASSAAGAAASSAAAAAAASSAAGAGAASSAAGAGVRPDDSQGNPASLWATPHRTGSPVSR